jgi:hypothetical protein
LIGFLSKLVPLYRRVWTISRWPSDESKGRCHIFGLRR